MGSYVKILAAALLMVVFCRVGVAQTVSRGDNLKKLLWDFAGYDMNDPRHEMDEPLYRLDNIDNTSYTGYLEDVANGYLHVRDGGPPCGCYFDNIVVGYNSSQGYVLLKNSYDYCPQAYTCSPSRSWSSILPDELNLEYFYDKDQKFSTDFTVFYIEVKLPRYGRETLFTTKLVPFGIDKDRIGIAYTGNIPFTNTNRSYSGADFSYFRSNIPDNIEDKETYSLKDLEELAGLIHGEFNSTYSWISAGEVLNRLSDLYKIYEEYKKVNFQTITTEWNATKSCFEIKKTEKHQKIEGFLNFLRSENYWIAVC